jgi:hypothetical protein
MTNLLIDLEGDVATAESYYVTFARIQDSRHREIVYAGLGRDLTS